VKFSDDVQIGSGLAPSPDTGKGRWVNAVFYTLEDMRRALLRNCRGDQELADRLIVEAEADVQKVRATFGRRPVSSKEVQDAMGSAKTREASTARAYVVCNQEAEK